MKRLLTIATVLIFTSMGYAQKFNPVTQINWPLITGSGSPSASCSSVNYGQPYQDTYVSPNKYYTCGSDGWAVRGAIYSSSNPLPVNSGGTGTSTPALVQGTNVVITGSFPNNTISVPYMPYLDLTGTVPTWNQDTTGSAAKLNGASIPASAKVLGTNSSHQLVDVSTAGAIPNTALANTSTTVNGQTCTLGSTCTVADSTKLPLSGGEITGNLIVDGTTTLDSGAIYTDGAGHLIVNGSDGTIIRNVSGQIYLSDGYETLIMDSGSDTITITDGAGTISLYSPGGNVQLGYSGVNISDNGSDSLSLYYDGSGATLQGTPTTIADAYGDLIYINNAVAISTYNSITLSENAEGTSIILTPASLVLSSTTIQLSGLYNTGSGTVCADSTGSLSISPSPIPCP